MIFFNSQQLFYEVDFSFSRNRKTDLHILREVNLRGTNEKLRGDILKLHQAAYAATFIEQTTEMDSPLPKIFELFREFLKQLCEKKKSRQIIFQFELKLLRELGLEPNWLETNLVAGTKKIAAILSRKDFAAGENLKLTQLQLEELRRFLHGFLIFHLDKLPKGRARALAENF